MSEVNYISLPKIDDQRGCLSFVENKNQIPFEIGNVKWIYDINKTGTFKVDNKELLVVSLAGSAIVKCNGSTYSLKAPNRVLHIKRVESFDLEICCENSAVAIIDSR